MEHLWDEAHEALVSLLADHPSQEMPYWVLREKLDWDRTYSGLGEIQDVAESSDCLEPLTDTLRLHGHVRAIPSPPEAPKLDRGMMAMAEHIRDSQTGEVHSASLFKVMEAQHEFTSQREMVEVCVRTRLSAGLRVFPQELVKCISGGANPAARNLGIYRGTGEIVPFCICSLLMAKWTYAFGAHLGLSHASCCLLSYFFHPKLRKIDVVLITLKANYPDPVAPAALSKRF